MLFIYYEAYIYVGFSLLSLALLMLSYKYYLLVLIVLELVVMGFSLMMFVYMGMKYLLIVFVYFLVFSVCESVLGLGIMDLIIRLYGNDYYSSFELGGV